MIQKTKKNSNHLWKWTSHTRRILPNLPVTKPKKLVPQMIYLTNLDLEGERKWTLPPLTPLDPAGREPGATSANSFSDVPGFLRCGGLKANNVQPQKFIPLTMPAVEEEKFSSTLKVPLNYVRIKVTGGRFTGEENKFSRHTIKLRPKEITKAGSFYTF